VISQVILLQQFPTETLQAAPISSDTLSARQLRNRYTGAEKDIAMCLGLCEGITLIQWNR
jgi:hypothetical protein